MLYFALYLAACWSVIAALTWKLFPGSTAVVGLIAAYSIVPIFLFLRRLRWDFYPGALFRVLVVRVLLYVQLLLPLVTTAGVIGALIGWPFHAALIAGRIGAFAVLVSMLVLFVVGYFGSRSLVVREVEARIASLPNEFDGMRIVQLSDLHVGPQRSASFLARVVRNVTAINADLIAVTGDLIDDRPEDVAVYAAAFDKLTAPMGVFMIAGNHDVYAGWSDVARELKRLVPGHVLVNESRLIKKGDATIAIVGTGDPAGAQRGVAALVGPDISRSMSSVPMNTIAIAFAHNPALFPALAQHNVALTLSGHTHWGQFAIAKRNWSLASPFLRYAMGPYQLNDSLLYISPGTGYWGIPFRVGALPEITVITIRRAGDGERPSITMGDSKPAPRQLRGGLRGSHDKRLSLTD